MISFQRPALKVSASEQSCDEYSCRARRSMDASQEQVRGLSCDEDTDEWRCCLYPLEVNFDEFGPDWDFIIEPRRYTANFCAGECPYSFASTPNAHLVHLQRGDSRRTSGGPCCTPRKMIGLNMIHLTNDDVNQNMKLLVTELPNMIVTECACR